jgi:two-component system, response regulator / RNA-binding antiterminator
MKSIRPPSEPTLTPLGSALGLRIVVVGTDLALNDPEDEAARQVAERGRQLRIGLLQNGYNVVAVLPADAFLDRRLAQLQPDLIIVDAESDARDALEHVVMATRDARRPIVLFTEDDDTTHVRDAVAAGVSAYIVAGLAPERIRPILEVAVARFDHEQGLRAELDRARTELSERRVMERAKAILAQRHQLTEPQAHERLRRAAMDRGMRLADVAQRIVDVSDLL